MLAEGGMVDCVKARLPLRVTSPRSSRPHSKASAAHHMMPSASSTSELRSQVAEWQGGKWNLVKLQWGVHAEADTRLEAVFAALLSASHSRFSHIAKVGKADLTHAELLGAHGVKASDSPARPANWPTEMAFVINVRLRLGRSCSRPWGLLAAASACWHCLLSHVRAACYAAACGGDRVSERPAL